MAPPEAWPLAGLPARSSSRRRRVYRARGHGGLAISGQARTEFRPDPRAALLARIIAEDDILLGLAPVEDDEEVLLLG